MRIAVALVLFIGLVMVSSKGLPGYILASENNLLKQTPNAAVYGDNHVKDLILHNLGMLETTDKASETARDLISKHGNKNILAIQKLNYAFLLESEPSSVLLNAENKASNEFKLKHQSALFNVCNGEECVINHLFNAQDEQSVISKLKKSVKKSNVEAYLYTDNANVAANFPESTLLSGAQESGEVYIVDPQSQTPFKIANSVSACFNEILKSKYVFDEKEFVVKSQDNLDSAVLIAGGVAKNDFVQYMNDICSVVGVSTLIRKDANPSFFAFHLTKLALTRHVICSKCEGKGGKEGAVRKCGGCQGRGVKVMLRQMGPMLQQIQQPCGECDGTGEVINQKDRCKTCSGKKVVSERKFLEVHIDKGMKGGQPITFAGESDQAPGVEPGDVIIIVDEKPHDRFRREGNDLFAEVELDLLTALGGGEFSILHLDDRALHVTIHPGEVVKHGVMKVIPGQGMPSHRHHEPGNLFVKLNIKFPDFIDPTLIPHLEAALPPREPAAKYGKEIMVEEVDMSDMDARQQEQAQRSQDAMDEDDDEQPRVQCANQ